MMKREKTYKTIKRRWRQKRRLADREEKDPLLAPVVSGSPAQSSLCPRRCPGGILLFLHKT